MAKYNALIIEDDEDLADAITASLELEGISFKATDNGKLGIDLIRSHEFDVIVIDIRIPGANGIQLASIAKSSPKNKNALIIITSGHVDKDNATKALSLGIKEIFVKPFPIKDLVGKIKAKST